jgi:hypothetical protein
VSEKDPTQTDGAGAGEDQDQQDRPGTEQQDEDRDQPGTGGGDQDESDDSEDGPSREAYAKLARKADRRERELRKAQAELAELKKGQEGGGEEDPVAKANQRLVRSAAKAALAEAGVPRDDQAAVLAVLNLGDIEVDEDGEVDEDEIQERVENLRRIFGGTGGKTRRQTPRVDTRDRSSGREQVDPDTARYRNILAGRG